MNFVCKCASLQVISAGSVSKVYSIATGLELKQNCKKNWSRKVTGIEEEID